MPRKPNPPPDDEDQAKRFIETAKALESDKTGDAFNKALGAVVPSKPPPPTKPSNTK
jgi:hypothetical protein